MQYRFAGICLDTASRQIRGPHGPLAVPRRVFDCLAYLLEHRDRAVSRDELILHVWNRNNVSDTQLAQAVLRARRLLCDDGSEQRLIRTVPGYGYHWVADVVVDAEPAEAPAAATLDEPAVAEPAAVTAVVERERRPARRAWLAAAVVALVALAAVLLPFGVAHLPTAATAAAPVRGRIVVLPVEMDAAGQADAAWARLGLMDQLAARLRAHGAVVPPSESVLTAIAALPEDAGLTSLRPQALQADLLIAPRLTRLASGWELSIEGRRASGADLRLLQQHPQILDAAAAAGDTLLLQLGVRKTAAASSDETALRLRAALLGNDLDAIRARLAQLPPAQRSHAETRYLAAELDYRAGQLDESRRQLDALLAETRAGQDDGFRGRVLVARGSVAMRQRDDAAAERDFAAAIETLESAGAGRDLGRALMGRGGIALRQQRLDRAQTDLSRARSLLAAAGDDLGVARAEVNIALLDRSDGRPLEALEQLQSAATRFGNYGAVNELSATLGSIVDLQCGLLRWNDAFASSDRALRLLPQLHDRQLRRGVLQRRADVLLGLGHLSAAADVLATLGREEERGATDYARGDLLRAELAAARGDRAAALALAHAVLGRAGASGQRDVAVRALLLLQTADAAADFMPADSADTAPGGAGTQSDVDSLLLQALALQSLDQNAAAEQLLRQALDRARERRDLRDQRHAAQAFSELLLRQRRGGDALDAVASLAEHKIRDYEIALLFARLHREQADIENWRSSLHKAAALAGERSLPAAVAAPWPLAAAASGQLPHAGRAAPWW